MPGFRDADDILNDCDVALKAQETESKLREAIEIISEMREALADVGETSTWLAPRVRRTLDSVDARLKRLERE